jgi:hypothetical protein
MEENYKYQWEVMARKGKSDKDLSEWSCNYGPKVVERNKDGKCLIAEFRVLIDNPDLDVFIVGNFNNWGEEGVDLEDYRLEKDEHKVVGKVDIEISHKDEYKFLVVNNVTGNRFFIQDAAGSYFTDAGNTVFWDFEDPSCYVQKYDFIDSFERSVVLLEK